MHHLVRYIWFLNKQCMFIRWLQCYSCISVQSRSLISLYPLCPTSTFIQPMFYVLRLPSYNLCSMSYVFLHTTYVLCPTSTFIQPMFYVLLLPSYNLCSMSYVYLHTTYVLCPTSTFIQDSTFGFTGWGWSDTRRDSIPTREQRTPSRTAGTQSKPTKRRHDGQHRELTSLHDGVLFIFWMLFLLDVNRNQFIYPCMT